MKYQDTQIAEAVASSVSWAQVYRKLTNAAEANKSSPGMQSHLKRRAILAEINFKHFKFKRKAKVVKIEDPAPVAA